MSPHFWSDHHHTFACLWVTATSECPLPNTLPHLSYILHPTKPSKPAFVLQHHLDPPNNPNCPEPLFAGLTSPSNITPCQAAHITIVQDGIPLPEGVSIHLHPVSLQPLHPERCSAALYPPSVDLCVRLCHMRVLWPVSGEKVEGDRMGVTFLLLLFSQTPSA